MVIMTKAAWEAWEAALSAYAEGNIDAAWLSLNRLSGLDPANTRARLLMAKLSLAERAYSRAVDLLVDFLAYAQEELADDKELSPLIIEGTCLLAAIYAHLGDNENASKLYWHILPKLGDSTPNKENAKFYSLTKLEVTSRLVGLSYAKRNPLDYKKAIAVYAYQLANITPYRHYAGQAKNFSDKIPLSLGYIANDYQAPSLRQMALTIAEQHDTEDFSVKFYRFSPAKNKCFGDELTSYSEKSDNESDFFPAITDLSGLTPQEAAARLHTDGLDIIIALSGFSPDDTAPFSVLAYCPAPVQLIGPGFGQLRPTELSFIDYIMGDSRLFGAYESPPADDEETERNVIDDKEKKRQEYYQSLAGANAAAESRYAGETMRPVHLGYNFRDLSRMADIIELDEEHSDDSAEETLSRLKREESRLAKKLAEMRSLGKNVTLGLNTAVAGLKDGLNKFSQKTVADEAAGGKNSPAFTVPYVKSHPEYTETLLVLPTTAWAAEFPPLEDNGPKEISEADTPPLRLFSLGDYRQYSAETLRLWQRLLAQYPLAKLTIYHDFVDANDVARFVKAPLVEAGIKAEQLDFVKSPDGPLPFLRQAAYDIVLDDGASPAAYLATAISQGLPLVTLDPPPSVKVVRFDRKISRTTLEKADCEDFIAPDTESYETIFQHLATDRSSRNELAKSLRQSFPSTPLAKADTFIKELEAAYRFIWQRYLDKATGRALENYAGEQKEIEAKKNRELAERAARENDKSFFAPVLDFFKRKGKKSESETSAATEEDTP